MINDEELKLIEELKKIRFLDSDAEDDKQNRKEVEEKIERYENIVYKLSSSGNISIIPYLCSVVEDNATELSSVEYLLGVIVKIAKNNIVEGIKEIIKGTILMIPQGKEEAEKLHITILQNQEMRMHYKEALKEATGEEKNVIKNILEEIQLIFKNRIDITDILNIF